MRERPLLVACSTAAVPATDTNTNKVCLFLLRFARLWAKFVMFHITSFFFQNKRFSKKNVFCLSVRPGTKGLSADTEPQPGGRRLLLCKCFKKQTPLDPGEHSCCPLRTRSVVHLFSSIRWTDLHYSLGPLGVNVSKPYFGDSLASQRNQITSRRTRILVYICSPFGSKGLYTSNRGPPCGLKVHICSLFMSLTYE